MRASAEMKGFVKPRRHELVLEGKESPPPPNKTQIKKEGIIGSRSNRYKRGS